MDSTTHTHTRIKYAKHNRGYSHNDEMHAHTHKRKRAHKANQRKNHNAMKNKTIRSNHPHKTITQPAECHDKQRN